MTVCFCSSCGDGGLGSRGPVLQFASVCVSVKVSRISVQVK